MCDNAEAKSSLDCTISFSVDVFFLGYGPLPPAEEGPTVDVDMFPDVLPVLLAFAATAVASSAASAFKT